MVDRGSAGASPSRTRQEAAGAARGVEQRLTQTRIDHVDHELRDGSRRVVFPRVAGRLQVFENLLVQVAEDVPVLRAVEVETLVELVDDLPQQRPRLHVLIGVLERVVNDLVTRTAIGQEIFQRYDGRRIPESF